MKIRTKLILIILGVLLVFGGTFYVLSSYSRSQILNSELENGIKDTEKEFNNAINNDVKMLSSSLDVFSTCPRCKDVYLEKDRDALYEISQPLFEQIKSDYGITHFYFHNPNGTNFLRVHDKEIYGDKITRFTFDQAKNSKEIGVGIELGKTAFALRVVKPYYSEEELIGYVELGEEIDHILDNIKSQTNNELAVIVKKEYLDEQKWASVRETAGLSNNWNDLEKYLIIDQTIEHGSETEEIAQKCFQEEIEEAHIDQHQSNDKDFLCGNFDLYDAGGRKVGSVLVLNDITETVGILNQVNSILLITFISLFIIVFLLYYAFISRYIINPIKKLQRGAEIIEKGDLDHKVKIDSKDEIGQLSRSFDRMTLSLKKARSNIEQEVNEKTADLEKLNSSMIGRELKMIELKKEINKLKNNQK